MHSSTARAQRVDLAIPDIPYSYRGVGFVSSLVAHICVFGGLSQGDCTGVAGCFQLV
jgi:hypothetical protein